MKKSKLRYLRWLRLREVHPDLTFHEFLTAPEWAEARRTP